MTVVVKGVGTRSHNGGNQYGVNRDVVTVTKTTKGKLAAAEAKPEY